MIKIPYFRLKTLQGYPITVDSKCTLGETDAKIISAKYSLDDKYIAAGFI